MSFAIAAFLMAIMPGPDNIFVLTESAVNGVKRGVFLALGLNLGVLVHTTISATGLSLFILQSETLFKFIQYLGVAYILYLAYLSATEKPNPKVNESNKKVDFKLFKTLRTGFVMNVLNPKVTLFFIAFLPQFVQPNQALSETDQLFLLGFVFMIVGFATFSVFAILSSRLKAFLFKGERWKQIQWVKTVVLIGFVIFLLMS